MVESADAELGKRRADYKLYMDFQLGGELAHVTPMLFKVKCRIIGSMKQK